MRSKGPDPAGGAARRHPEPPHYSPHDVRMDGVEFFRASAVGSAGRVLDPGDYSYCVMVKSGRLRLEIDFPKAVTLELRAGDVVAVSGLASHVFLPDTGAEERVPFERAPMGAPPQGAPSDGRVDLIVGVVPNEVLALGSLMIGPIAIQPASHPLLARQVWRVAEMLEEEYEGAAPPYQALVVRRLAEIILINMSRRLTLEEQDGAEYPSGPAPAGAERHIVRALDAVFETPALNWDLPQLARAAGMSRTRFAETFKSVTGHTPGHLISRWRLMEIARHMVSDNLSVEAAAELAGYSSAAAFVRAFRREHGETPGRWRRRRLAEGVAHAHIRSPAVSRRDATRENDHEA